jgi:phage-related protein
MINYLTFAGRSTNEFGIWISGEGTYGAPERNVQTQEVAGRNGNLLFDMGNFRNITIKYPAAIKTDMPSRIRDFLNFAGSQVGYQRLEDTYHPYEYRMARFQSKLSIDSAGYMNRSGKFTLEFDCKPQRFLKSGEDPIDFTGSGILYNRTEFDAKPLLRVFGSGAGSVGIGSQTITISSISEYVDIDCEIMDAYKGAVNCNGNVSFTDDIVLKPGNNNIAKTGNISKVTITPRWWII